MPPKPKRPCGKPGCRELTTSRHCIEHTKQHAAAKQQEHRQYDSQRGSASSRGYGSTWRKIRRMVLDDEPLCRRCNKVQPAELVHHIDRDPSNNKRSNLEPLCISCHETEHKPERFGIM